MTHASRMSMSVPTHVESHPRMYEHASKKPAKTADQDLPRSDFESHLQASGQSTEEQAVKNSEKSGTKPQHVERSTDAPKGGGAEPRVTSSTSKGREPLPRETAGAKRAAFRADTRGVPGETSTMHSALMESAGESTAYARVFLEHWYGNGYLSTVVAGKGSAGANAATPGIAVGEANRAGSIEGARSSPLSGESGISNTFQETVPDSRAGLEENDFFQRFDTRAASIEASSGQFDVSPDAVRYPTSLIWQSLSESGLPTLWIRDFTIQEDDRTSIASQALLLARKAGRNINRIMINGRLAWSAVQAGNPSKCEEGGISDVS